MNAEYRGSGSNNNFHVRIDRRFVRVVHVAGPWLPVCVGVCVHMCLSTCVRNLPLCGACGSIPRRFCQLCGKLSNKTGDTCQVDA